MSLKCGILGLPNVGKSTCFNALSQVMRAKVDNRPFSTIQPEQATVPVPDPRLSTLGALVRPKKTIAATVEFVDIAGLVKGASKGEGLGNEFLSHVKSVDALVHVVRCFEDPDIIHVMDSVDPIRDIEIIEMELMLSDLTMLENLLKTQQHLLKKGDKKASDAVKLLIQVKASLEKGTLLNTMEWAIEDFKQLKKWQFLSIKPMLYLANVSEETLKKNASKNNLLLEAVYTKAKALSNTKVLVNCVKLEAELIGNSLEERNDLLTAFSYRTQGLGELIRQAYYLLGLHTFFTVGPEEVRAWTIPIGTTASEAAGYIHSDLQKGFIKAEVVSYEDFIQCTSIQAAKEKGKLHLRGAKELLLDGDIVHFRYNL